MGGDLGSSNYEDGEILQGRQKRQRVVEQELDISIKKSKMDTAA
jgi:hypothetical protein